MGQGDGWGPTRHLSQGDHVIRLIACTRHQVTKHCSHFETVDSERAEIVDREGGGGAVGQDLLAIQPGRVLPPPDMYEVPSHTQGWCFIVWWGWGPRQVHTPGTKRHHQGASWRWRVDICCI